VTFSIENGPAQQNPSQAKSKFSARWSVADLKALALEAPAPKKLLAIVEDSFASETPAFGWIRDARQNFAGLESYQALIFSADWLGEESALAELPGRDQFCCIASDAVTDEGELYWLRKVGFDSFMLRLKELDIAVAQYLLEVGRDLGIEAVFCIDNASDAAKAMVSDAKIIALTSDDPDLLDQVRDQIAGNHLPRMLLAPDFGSVTVQEFFRIL